MIISDDTIPNGSERIGSEVKPTVTASRPVQIYKCILFGTDFSAASGPAFDQALKLARQNGAELLIAHAFVPPDSLSYMPPECYHQWATQFRAETEGRISALIQSARKNKVKAHMLILSGPADNAILKAAKQLGVDLIVIGTHGHRGVSRFFLGSIANQLVTRAPCAVLTVRPPGALTSQVSR